MQENDTVLFLSGDDSTKRFVSRRSRTSGVAGVAKSSACRLRANAAGYTEWGFAEKPSALCRDTGTTHTRE